MNLNFTCASGSVMQYDETSFSKNGRPTMTARDGSRLGNERGFSEVFLAMFLSIYLIFIENRINL